MTKQKQIITRDVFLGSARHLKKVLLPLGELGSMYVRELTGAQMIRFNERIKDMKAEGLDVSAQRAMHLAAVLVSMSACDQDGNLLFQETDIDQLSELPFRHLRAIAERALELSGVYEVAANLKKAMSEPSTQNSPSPEAAGSMK
jgi:hypothetical protein